MCRLSGNLGASTSWNSQGLSRDRCNFTIRPRPLPPISGLTKFAQVQSLHCNNVFIYCVRKADPCVILTQTHNRWRLRNAYRNNNLQTRSNNCTTPSVMTLAVQTSATQEPTDATVQNRVYSPRGWDGVFSSSLPKQNPDAMTLSNRPKRMGMNITLQRARTPTFWSNCLC